MTDCELSCEESVSVQKELRVTGSSCLALKNAVAKLNRLDDFHRETIGSGFFSEVYKVRHKTTGQVMVLKMNLVRSNRSNMRKEVQLMNQLSHPNILKFMGVCVHEGQLHALTEFINGGRLEQIIQDRSIALSYSVRMKLALDIAKGMEYLHSKGVFHRDLTSKNILVRTNEDTGEMTAVVGDFGLAAKIPSKCGYRLATVGSAYWMSPECLKREFYNELSDIFSYGIVLCELIGRCEADPDFLPRTESFGLDYIAFTRLCVADPPPPAFLRLAFTCCSYDPSKRPSFTENVATLESIIWNSKNPSSKENNCHAMLVNKKSGSDERIRALGEVMAEQDEHYKPSQQNPFTNISFPKTGKKLRADSSSDADDTCSRVVIEPVVKPSRLRSATSTGPWLEGGLLYSRRPGQAYGLLDAILAGSCYHSPRQKARVEGGMPPSLPSSPTFTRRAATATHKPQSAPPTAGYRLRACSSGSNLASLEDHVTVLRRRGSCESGFFSSMGDDFCIPECYVVGQELVASSVTLSSSSAASSLLLDSAAGEEKIGGRWRANRASSVYTGSSEDISLHSDQTEEKLRPQQIHKMVEYFERKGSSAEQREYLRHFRPCARRGGRSSVNARLLVCEGAVSSKLPIFDKK